MHYDGSAEYDMSLYHVELLETIKKLIKERLGVYRFDLTQSTGTLPPTQLPPAGGSGGGGTRGGVVLSDDDPSDVTSGSADPGASDNASRADHVHHTAATAVADGDKGDITVSGSGAVWTIDPDVVTFAKMQNIASDRLIGRDTAGSGDPEELTVGGGVEFTGSGGIQRSALTGDATASAGSGAVAVVKIQGRAVAASAPSNDDALIWNAGGSTWQPGALSAGALDGLTDVQTTGEVSGVGLFFDGSVWRPAYAPAPLLLEDGTVAILEDGTAAMSEPTYL